MPTSEFQPKTQSAAAEAVMGEQLKDNSFIPNTQDTNNIKKTGARSRIPVGLGTLSIGQKKKLQRKRNKAEKVAVNNDTSKTNEDTGDDEKSTLSKEGDLMNNLYDSLVEKKFSQ